jgi:hypothetical protein
MKKKIRILKNDKRVDHGTFLNEDPLFIQTVNDLENNSSEQENDDKLNDKYKKKKVMNKNSVSNSGLKYLNPSQRNHSSIYE